MWKDYSIGYIKNSRASSISIMAAAFISTLFLSFLCSMFYNFWVYEVQKVTIEEGDWQGRITGTLTAGDILTIQNFANVERTVVNQELSGPQETVVDVYFQDVRTIFRDLPLITERLGLGEDADSYHLLLLSRYLVHDPQDESPPLLLTVYLVILLMVSLSLILIIHNSFAVSINDRVRQFGIFSSIGASPAQIRTCLMQEAAALCAVPILLGSLLGIALSCGAYRGMDVLGADIPGRLTIPFQYHPAIFAITILSSSLTVLFSAWLPAGRLSRLTPLKAIRGAGVMGLKRKRRSPILSMLLGIEGELAGNALKAHKKSLRTSTLSLTLSFLGFTTMLCLFSLTDLSTKYTYFQKYQDKWDVMVTVKDTRVEDFGLTGELDELEGVRDSTVYQKAGAMCRIHAESISGELEALGGPEAVAGDLITWDEGTLEAGTDAREAGTEAREAGTDIREAGTEAREAGTKGSWLVKAPIIIMDDASFGEYCASAGVEPRLDGTIVLNRIWNSLNSNFRCRDYIPFLKEDKEPIVLQNAANGKDLAKIPVLAYTQKAPVLKEEYADYALAQFIPLSLWKTVSGQIGGSEADTYIRILAGEEAGLTQLNELEQRINQLLGPAYNTESENRILDKVVNDNIINSYKLVIGAFCSLLAVIGIANVFSYTLGFLRLRKQEFAQYMSVGMTPAGMRKMFCAEALVIAGRPILITLPLSYLFVVFTAKASFLDPAKVWPEIPFSTIAVFSLAIIAFVALAYYMGARKVLASSLADALRDDTM